MKPQTTPSQGAASATAEKDVATHGLRKGNGRGDQGGFSGPEGVSPMIPVVPPDARRGRNGSVVSSDAPAHGNAPTQGDASARTNARAHSNAPATTAAPVPASAPAPASNRGVRIEAHGLGLGVRARHAYEHVDVTLEPGQAHAILGKHKSGKTELLLTFAGRMLPTAGECTVDGISVRRLGNLRTIRSFSGLGFFDNVNDVQRVLKVRTVTSAELGLYGKKSGHAATESYLRSWGLDGYADMKIDDLDQFTYVKLGIALGMCGDPRLLVVDDVESDLTEPQTMQLVTMLADLAHGLGITVVCGILDDDLHSMHFDTVTTIGDQDQQTADASSRVTPASPASANANESTAQQGVAQ